MQESVVEILEAFGGLIVEGWQVEEDGKSRGTRAMVVVSWDVVAVNIIQVDIRGYESEDGGGQRNVSEGIEDMGNIEADELEYRGYLALDVMRVLLGWGEMD